MSSLVKKTLKRLHQIVKLPRSRMVRPALHSVQLSRLTVNRSFEYERPDANLPLLQIRKAEQASTLTGSRSNTYVYSTHPFTPANSLCTRQPYNESTSKPAHSDTLLIHVYERIWTLAIIAKTLDNKCAVSFCIQCTRYSMLQIRQGPYQATLCCKEKYTQPLGDSAIRK